MEKPKSKVSKIPNTNLINKNTRKQRPLTLKKENKAHIDWVNKSKIDRHIEDLQTWAFQQVEDVKQKVQNKQPVMIKSMQSWLNERYIHRSLLGKWMTQYPELKEAVENARAILSELREIVVSHGNINTATVMASWPAYCPEARDIEIFRAEQKAKAQIAQQPKSVGIPIHALFEPESPKINDIKQESIVYADHDESDSRD